MPLGPSAVCAFCCALHPCAPLTPGHETQVRFGVLNAGNYGVSQSRKRTFIWGVAPGNNLPEWPAPLHVFRSPQLTIKLPGGAQARAPAAGASHLVTYEHV